jgi:hypothetical protein
MWKIVAQRSREIAGRYWVAETVKVLGGHRNTLEMLDAFRNQPVSQQRRPGERARARLRLICCNVIQTNRKSCYAA